MSNFIKTFLFITILSVFFQVKANIQDCIFEADALKEECAYKCISKHACANACPANYVLTPCMARNCDNREEIQDCINKCDQYRSDHLNTCINKPCQNPWVACPSCGMDI